MAGAMRWCFATSGSRLQQLVVEQGKRTHHADVCRGRLCRRSGPVGIEPFVGLAWVGAGTGAFAETGGAAALSGWAKDQTVVFSSLGVRLTGTEVAQGTIAILPRMAFAWQHAFGTLIPAQSVEFEATSQSFVTLGVPLDADVATVQAGLDLVFSPSARFGVGYDGEMSSRTRDSAVRADLSWDF